MQNEFFNSDYIGILNYEDEVNLIFNELHLGRFGTIAAFKFAAIRLGCYPCEMRFGGGNEFYCFTSLMKYFINQFNHDPKNDIVAESHDFEKYLIELKHHHVVIFVDNVYERQNNSEAVHNDTSKFENRGFKSINIYFKPESSSTADQIISKCIKFKLKGIKKNFINMICLGHDEDDDEILYLKKIKIKDPKIKDLELHYGSAFSEVHDKIMNELNKEQSHGLILLHGLPGTGKTNYIRYLINIIKNKEIIYIPPEMVELISQPQYLPFMLEHTDSILIIEDAENILKSRSSDETTTQSVANLLNLSDGLLGDSLRQPIIATFNCELNRIDPALLRKGRLIAEYEFGKLSVENAQKMSDHLGYTSKITEPMVLADIYFQD